MTVNQKLVSLLRKSAFAAAAVFAFVQCSEEEELTSPAVSAVTKQTTASSAAINQSITSLTISGVNTTFATAKDCETCTYVVPNGTTLVDGKELGLKPGSVICLNTLFNYGALELTNIEGTTENPIVITTVGENINDPSIEPTAANGDPY